MFQSLRPAVNSFPKGAEVYLVQTGSADPQLKIKTMETHDVGSDADAALKFFGCCLGQMDRTFVSGQVCDRVRFFLKLRRRVFV
jgi:hypothetical protein